MIDHGTRKGDITSQHRDGCHGTMCPDCGCCEHCRQEECKCPAQCTDEACSCNPNGRNYLKPAKPGRAKEK